MAKEIVRYKLGTYEIIIEINLSESRKLEKQFGLKLADFFVDNEKTMEAVQKLILEDEFTIDLLWYYFSNQHKVTREVMEEQITSLDLLDHFREQFWAAVINFTSAHKKKILLDLWDQVKKQIKKFDVAEMISNASSLELEEEELTSTPLPSEKFST
jgi:hypothetical protein